MKKLTLIVFAMLSMIIVTTACSKTKNQEAKESDSDKMVVCYFSATGTTEKQARKIAELTGAELLEIVPEIPYTDEDLNWRDSLSRSSMEMADSASRPVVKSPDASFEDYDVVFIGYPNWWNTCPRVINTFIEAANLDGKTVVPFMTSGGSNITNSEKELAHAYPAIKWKKGLLMNEVSDSQIMDWLETIKNN